MKKFQLETKTFGNCYFTDGICVFMSKNRLCTNEDAKYCRFRQVNGDPIPAPHKKCYYPADCERQTPGGYCTLPIKSKCSYRGNNPLAEPDTQKRKDVDKK